MQRFFYCALICGLALCGAVIQGRANPVYTLDVASLNAGTEIKVDSTYSETDADEAEVSSFDSAESGSGGILSGGISTRTLFAVGALTGTVLLSVNQTVTHFRTADSKTSTVQVVPGVNGQSSASSATATNDLPISLTPSATSGGSSEGSGIEAAAVTPMPEPATMLLFGSGLLSVGAAVRRRRSSK